MVGKKVKLARHRCLCGDEGNTHTHRAKEANATTNLQRPMGGGGGARPKK